MQRGAGVPEVVRSEHVPVDLARDAGGLHGGVEHPPPPVAATERAAVPSRPKPVPLSPLDAMPAAVRADVLASAEAGLIDRGDVVPEWRDDAQREHFARIIDREARQLAARHNAHRPERVSA